MKNFIVLFYLSATFSSVAISGVTDENELFSVFCKEKKVTGFNWKSDNWQKASFKKDEYIVTKVEKTPKHLFCNPDKKTTDAKNSKMTESCYSIRKLGEEVSWINVHKCLEEWEKSSNKLSRLSCDLLGGKMYLQLEGWFHRSHLHGKMDGDKDSLLLSVGKCSKI